MELSQIEHFALHRSIQLQFRVERLLLLCLLRISDNQIGDLGVSFDREVLQLSGAALHIKFQRKMGLRVGANIDRQPLDIRSGVEGQLFACLLRGDLEVEPHDTGRRNLPDERLPICQIEPVQRQVERRVAGGSRIIAPGNFHGTAQLPAQKLLLILHSGQGQRLEIGGLCRAVQRHVVGRLQIERGCGLALFGHGKLSYVKLPHSGNERGVICQIDLIRAVDRSRAEIQALGSTDQIKNLAVE